MNTGMVKSPCKGCPFRKDIPVFLHRPRAIEIARALEEDDVHFVCHETLGPEEDLPCDAYPDGDGGASFLWGQKVCAGSIAVCEGSGFQPQLVRIFERVNRQPVSLVGAGLCYADLDAFRAAHRA